MRRGLVVGKFMPLHRGHQFVIETALANADDVTVVVYDEHPDGVYPPMPAAMRARWITTLYPQLENVITRRDMLDELTGPHITQEERDDPKYASFYAKDLEFLGHFDYVFSSEDYGDPFAKALGAESWVVDPGRLMLPISGTQIRENVYEYRGWVDPIVYRDLIQKVVFVGTESAGKSTIAKQMAAELDTQWVHEYGRELWEAQNLTGTFHDMMKIAENQYRREQQMALHSRDFLFCDTNAWTTLQWSLWAYGTADQRLYDLVERTKHEYIWILCKNDFGWVQDGTRELKGEKSIQFQKQQEHDLAELTDGSYETIFGSLQERISQVKEIIRTRATARLVLPVSSTFSQP